jgi:hypothetical protein
VATAAVAVLALDASAGASLVTALGATVLAPGPGNAGPVVVPAVDAGTGGPEVLLVVVTVPGSSKLIL